MGPFDKICVFWKREDRRSKRYVCVPASALSSWMCTPSSVSSTSFFFSVRKVKCILTGREGVRVTALVTDSLLHFFFPRFHPHTPVDESSLCGSTSIHAHLSFHTSLCSWLSCQVGLEMVLSSHLKRESAVFICDTRIAGESQFWRQLLQPSSSADSTNETNEGVRLLLVLHLLLSSVVFLNILTPKNEENFWLQK